MADDPFRADAAVVFRDLRDTGPGSGDELAARCFPVSGEMPESTRTALLKRSRRRVLDSIVWMRHQGVTISVVPDADGSVFHLGEIEIDAASQSYTLFIGGKVVRRGSWSKEPVTAKVSQPSGAPSSDHPSDAMDVWHGGG